MINLETFSDKDLFDLRDKLTLNATRLAHAKKWAEAEAATQDLDTIEDEITRRDHVRFTYAKEEYCCHQCYQIDKGEF